MRSTKKPQEINNKPILAFPNFDKNFYEGISFIEKNEVKNGVNILFKCSDFKAFETLKPTLQNIVRNNIFLHLDKFANRVYQTESQLKIANVEFNLINRLYAKFAKNDIERAKALHIKFKYNIEAHQYDIALATANVIIALDPKPEYYHALVKTYHALGQYDLALKNAKIALELARRSHVHVDDNSYEKIIINLEKKLQKSTIQEPAILNALNLIIQNKVEEGVNLIKSLLPLKAKIKTSAKITLGEDRYYEVIENLFDDLVRLWMLFEESKSSEVADTIIWEANLILNLSDNSNDCARAHHYLGKIFFDQLHFSESLDHFKKVLEIHPTDELTQITIKSIEDEIMKLHASQFDQAELNPINDLSSAEKKSDPLKKKKKKKKKKNPDSSSKTAMKVNHEAQQLKDKFIEITKSITATIDEKDAVEFEKKAVLINKVLAEAKLIQCNSETENKQLNDFLISHFNKLFSAMFLQLQNIEQDDEKSASALYQNLLILTPLNSSMKKQIATALQKLQKKNTQMEEAKKTIPIDSADILKKISHLPKSLEFDLAIEELRAELKPDQYHESDPDNIEKIYQQYKTIDLEPIIKELLEKLDLVIARNTKKKLLTIKKELEQKAKQQKEIITLYEKIKDKEEAQHQASIKEEMDRLQSLCIVNKNFIQEVIALKNLSITLPESAKAKLIAIQNDIKNNAAEITKRNIAISTNLTKPLASQKNEFVMQLANFKRKFEEKTKDLERDRKNYIEAKNEVEQNIQIIEKEELPLMELLANAKLIWESKNEVSSLNKKIENLQKIHEEIQKFQKKLEIYPYFATHSGIRDADANIAAAIQHTETLLKTYEILHKTGAGITIDEQIKLSENYQVTWKGGFSQLVGAMLYTDSKIAERVVINDADSLILDEFPASISLKLTTEFKYQLNNPQLKKPKSKLFKASDLNFIQLKKSVSGFKDDLVCVKEIDLTIGDKKTYIDRFITGFAAGRLIIVPSSDIIEEKNYDIIHLANHKLCIDKTDPYYEDFKFAFTDKTYLVARYDKEIHKNHSYVVVKNYKKMCDLFGEKNVIKNAKDRLAGDDKTTLICYEQYKSELYSVFSNQYSLNPISCYQEVNSLVLNYGFQDKDVKPFLQALIQVIMEQDFKIIPKVAKIEDSAKFIEEVIFNLCFNYPDVSKIENYDAEKFNRFVSDAILNTAKHRNITSETRDTLRVSIASSLGLTTPETITTETVSTKVPERRYV